jgi:hypothetical protein
VRNSSVADLPAEITVGNVNLQLDVRFTESNNRESATAPSPSAAPWPQPIRTLIRFRTR